MPEVTAEARYVFTAASHARAKILVRTSLAGIPDKRNGLREGSQIKVLVGGSRLAIVTQAEIQIESRAHRPVVRGEKAQFPGGHAGGDRRKARLKENWTLQPEFRGSRRRGARSDRCKENRSPDRS